MIVLDTGHRFGRLPVPLNPVTVPLTIPGRNTPVSPCTATIGVPVQLRFYSEQKASHNG